MDASLNGHSKGPNIIAEWVWFEGVDALKEGEAVCYNADYMPSGGAATDYDARRGNRVERPSITNNMAFAGVAARSYPARSTGQLVEIYIPGSKGVKVALGVDTVIGTGLLSFIAGTGGEAGRFYTGKYKGRGSAIPRQTKTAVLKASMTGAISIATDGITVTLVAHGAAAGDTLCLLGGEMEDATKYVVPGKHVIASITSADVVVLAASCCVGTPAGAVTATGFFYTGNPTCQADLLTGDECGGVDFMSDLNAGNATPTYMKGGLSYVCGGITYGADLSIVFAQGTFIGEKKGFIVLGTLTTSTLVIDLATNGIQTVRHTDGTLLALAEVNAMDAAGDQVYFQFNGATWAVTDVLGDATEA